MGYRSQVVIGFKKEAFFKHVGTAEEYFKDCDTIREDKTDVVFIWDDVKWYDSYKDVRGIMEVFYKCLNDPQVEEEDAEASCGFIRVGEDDDDIEMIGSPWEFKIQVSISLEHYGGGVDTSAEEFFKPNSVKFITEEK